MQELLLLLRAFVVEHITSYRSNLAVCEILEVELVIDSSELTLILLFFANVRNHISATDDVFDSSPCLVTLPRVSLLTDDRYRG